jgi:hypothetical protein
MCSATLRSIVSRRHQAWQFALVIALGSWLILACTAPRIPIVWDEGYYLLRADQMVAWFRLLFDARNPHGGLSALSSTVIHEHWLFINRFEGHPAWFAVPIALSKALLSGVLGPLTAARIGPITVFSIACGAVAHRLKQDYGAIAAWVAPIALLTLPRMFSDAHFAALDGQVTAWWLLLWAADSSNRQRTGRALVVGVLLGLTGATKFTGWFAALPVTLSRALTRDREQRRELLLLIPVALLTFYAVNPPLWHTPLVGVVEHVRLNLGRPDVNVFGVGPSRWPGVSSARGRPQINLRDYLVGSMRDDSRHPYPPWYNTVAWLLLVTPIPTLVLGLVGLAHCIGNPSPGTPSPRHECFASIRVRPFGRWLPEPKSFALLGHWVTLMAVRALPGAPWYDGIRLFLPAFGFWCVLAGIGAQRIWEADSRHQGQAWRRQAVRVALIAALAASALNLARYYPQTLSHYSLLVSGVRGAANIGMAPTYWWDALDDDVLDWLNSHTEPGAAVAFSEISDVNVTLLREWGRLQTSVTDPNWGTSFKWYVLQNRSGLLSGGDRVLIQSEKPAFTKYAGRHPHGVPADLNVPLIFVFGYEQYQRAVSSSGLN